MFRNVLDEIFFYLYSHERLDKKVQRGLVSDEVGPHMAVPKPKDNFKKIKAMEMSLKRHRNIIILIILGHCNPNLHLSFEFQNL